MSDRDAGAGAGGRGAGVSDRDAWPKCLVEWPECLVEWPEWLRGQGYVFRPVADPHQWTLLYPGNLVGCVQFDELVVVSDADDTVYDLWFPDRDTANRFMARLPSVVEHGWVRSLARGVCARRSLTLG